MSNFFQTVAPCEALKKYVACYYFIKSEDQNFRSRHYSFPHTYNALSIYKDGSFEARPSNFSAIESLTPNYQLFLQVKRQAPLMVNIAGKINRATVLFKDFGINHFINQPLSAVMGYDVANFSSWDEFPDFPSYLNSLFDEPELEKKARIIDNFLLQHLRPVNLSYLEEAILLLCDFEKNTSVEHIADQLHVSLRSFNRNFKEMLGVSPIEYRRIAQFRHSIDNKLFQSQFKRLTDIGYESHFYDQSYFNKIYHKLTGSNPKTFFKSIERIGDDQLIFQFVKK